VKSIHHKLIEVLREARELLARPDNNFALSSWKDTNAALSEIDRFISRLERGGMPKRSEIEPLVLASGPIQRVSVPSGWSQEFIVLADRFDEAIKKAYRVDSLLGDELEGDVSLWRRWQEDGVTESTLLSVDFSFNASDETVAQELANILRQAGLTQVEVRMTQTLLVFKNWTVSAVEEGTWSLEKLQDRSRIYCDLAAKYRARCEGCGAIIPDIKRAPST
jgi:hypothetical protein